MSTDIYAQVDVSEGWVEFRIKNSNGYADKASHMGLGLRNLNDRLKLLYADRHELLLRDTEEYFVASVRIPR